MRAITYQRDYGTGHWSKPEPMPGDCGKDHAFKIASVAYLALHGSGSQAVRFNLADGRAIIVERHVVTMARMLGASGNAYAVDKMIWLAPIHRQNIGFRLTA